MYQTIRRAVIVAIATAAALPAAADVALRFNIPHIPNFIGLGIGPYPQYYGSDDYNIGAAPFGRISWGNRFFEVLGNVGQLNLLDHPNWRLGPSGVLRLGRRNVDNDKVDALPDINPALELGGFVAYAGSAGPDVRSMWNLGASVNWDVTGAHEGYVANAIAERWFPVRRYGIFGLMLSTNYGSDNYQSTYYSISAKQAAASGLPQYNAGAGFRNVAATALYLQPVSEKWIVGAGAQYGRIVGDAADSPIVKDEGTPNQYIVGIGIARMFGVRR